MSAGNLYKTCEPRSLLKETAIYVRPCEGQGREGGLGKQKDPEGFNELKSESCFIPWFETAELTKLRSPFLCLHLTASARHGE